MSRLYAVVLAGGRGGRFWPLSREDRPKPFLPLAEGGASLLAATCRRLEGLVESDKLFVVGRSDHAELVQRELPALPPGNFLRESKNRGTAAAVALAARAVHEEDPDGLLLVCPSDHLISTGEEFARTVRFAKNCYHRLPAGNDPATVVLGVEANSPADGYGYIVRGEAVEESEGLQCHQVSSYVEKPEREIAEALVEGGDVLWSTGIFIWSAAGYLRLLDAYLPGMINVLDGVGGESLPHGVSVDHGILEKSESVAVVRASFSWTDVGTWDRYASQMQESGAGNRVRGNFVGLDTEDCIVLSDRRIIGAVGVRDLVIVETEEAILVCHRDCAERVRELAEEIDRSVQADPHSPG